MAEEKRVCESFLSNYKIIQRMRSVREERDVSAEGGGEKSLT